MQSLKEAMFTWSVWHNIVVVQSWRAKITLDISTNAIVVISVLKKPHCTGSSVAHKLKIHGIMPNLLSTILEESNRV